VKFSELGECPVPAYQNLAEFGHLWEFLETRAPATLLEVGSLYGGTLWHWAHLPTLTRLISVDQPVPPSWDLHAGVMEARTHWTDWFAGLDFHDVQGDSHSPKIVKRVRELLDGDLVDVAFLDGDHSEAGVRRDFELWAPFVKPGGVVAFHDTIPNGNRHEPGVVKLVGELRWRGPSVEFFDPDGVGIFALVV
jgi:cephalosporin hydroxylase